MTPTDVTQALILDFGGVLTWPQGDEAVEAMARSAGVSREAFRAAYDQHRDPYDAGYLSAAEYWRQVLETLGRRSTASGPVVERLTELDVASWTRYREETWTLARSFRADGRRTAMLSNCPREILARIRAHRRLEAWFDVVAASCEIACVKPDPHIYEVCLSRLGVAAGQALFVDDRAANVEAASRLGIQTMHFADDDPVRDLRLRLGSR